jgi:GntR family transcriptional regulator
MIRALNHDSYIPLYLQAEMMIRELIQLQEYQDGKLLPDEVSLAETMGVSRNTVRQAMDRLVHEGVISRKKGVGTKVAFKTVTTQLDNWHSFTHEMSDQGIPFENLEIKVKWDAPPKEVAAFFAIDGRRTVLRLDRLRRLDKGGLVYFTSWLHPRLTLDGTEDYVNTPLYDLIESQTGHVPSLSEEEIGARGADSTEAKKINVRQGAHVLVRKRKVFDDQDRPIEFNIGIYDAELFTYSIKIKRHEMAQMA